MVLFPAHTNEVPITIRALVDTGVEGLGGVGADAREEGIRLQVVTASGVDIGPNRTLDVRLLNIGYNSSSTSSRGGSSGSGSATNSTKGTNSQRSVEASGNERDTSIPTNAIAHNKSNPAPA